MPIPTDLRLDPRDIEERGVLRTSVADQIVSRIRILLSIYFLEGWRRDKRQALLSILEDYLSLFANKVTHYVDYRKARLARWSGGGLPELYRNLHEISPGKDLAYQMLHVDPQDRDNPSLWRIMGHGFGTNNVTRLLSAVKVHLPPSFVFESPDRFAGIVRRWCDRLGAIHGSGGLGVLTVPGLEASTLEPYHYPFVIQYPGLEYDAMGSYWSATRFGGFEKPRSSNWLTILGDDNVQALGGLPKVRSSLGPDMDLASYEGGILIRAGRLPALGSAETGGVPEAYRKVARLIKPIRYEGYRSGVIGSPAPLDDLDVTLAWLRRFD